MIGPGCHYHVAGVAGVGMSALAELLLGLGCEVSGSDRSHDQGQRVDLLERLVHQGLRLLPQDGTGVRSGTRALLVSTAIEQDNVELTAARRCGVEVVHRAAMLARLAEGREVVAIAGTAGKTTVTALTGWLLEQAGLDPTVVNGGVILNWSTPHRAGNVRVGRTGPWVFEVDESDRSLLNFHPRVAAITNVSKDHFELPEVVALFQRFAQQVNGDVLCGAGVDALLGVGSGRLKPEPAWTPSGNSFPCAGRAFRVPLIGRHNLDNAFMAVRVCEALGADLDVVAAALPRFAGVGRRLERAGLFRGAAVYDDYAHNPAKMAAAWRAVAETAARVLGYWRPHGFGPLNLMRNELADALQAAMRDGDRLFVLPVFYAGGTANPVLTADAWVRDLQARGVSAEYVEDYVKLRARLEKEARPGAAILGMGARDPGLPAFARELAGVSG
jgi:UDP-N-acetylmuramate--alanine ligase